MFEIVPPSQPQMPIQPPLPPIPPSPPAPVYMEAAAPPMSYAAHQNVAQESQNAMEAMHAAAGNIVNISI